MLNGHGRWMGKSASRASCAWSVLVAGLFLVSGSASAKPPRLAKNGAVRPTPPPIRSDQASMELAAAGPPSTMPHADSVAIFEYRNDVKQFADLTDRLTLALQQNTSLGVINQLEARRRLGAVVDAEVARCDGETRCLSAVGERLKVKEVLLVAVSQLGDVVISLQRIDVVDRRVITRYADSLSSGQQVDEPRLLGWLQQLYPPETFKRYGQIRITTDVGGAQVYLNAKAKGNTPLDEPISVLAPGNYRLLVEKARYSPFQANLTVMPDTVVEVDARLVRESYQQPWYRRWYVWAGIGAGLAAVAATGVAIYFGTSQPPPDMTKVPAIVNIR